MNTFKWLEDWYKSNCNGDWEHCYGISIGTMDNPGWHVKIEFCETDLEGKIFKNIEINKGDNNWINCKVEDDVFHGMGDSNKLEQIIEIFKDFAENQNDEQPLSENKVESWNDFIEKINNKEQRRLNYKGLNILLNYYGKNDYLLITDLDNTLNLIETAEHLLNVIFCKTIKEVWDEIELFSVLFKIEGEESSVVKFSYEQFLYELLRNKKSFKILYNNQSCIAFYFENVSSETVGFTWKFKSSEELIQNARFYGKKIEEIWIDLH